MPLDKINLLFTISTDCIISATIDRCSVNTDAGRAGILAFRAGDRIGAIPPAVPDTFLPPAVLFDALHLQPEWGLCLPPETGCSPVPVTEWRSSQVFLA